MNFEDLAIIIAAKLLTRIYIYIYIYIYTHTEMYIYFSVNLWILILVNVLQSIIIINYFVSQSVPYLIIGTPSSCLIFPTIFGVISYFLAL